MVFHDHLTIILTWVGNCKFAKNAVIYQKTKADLLVQNAEIPSKIVSSMAKSEDISMIKN